MPLHPLTSFFCAASFLGIVLFIPLPAGCMLLIAALSMIAVLPSRSQVTSIQPFLKLLAIGAVFLVLIHGVNLFPLSIDQQGLVSAARYLIRISAVFTAILFLVRQITGDDLYAFLIDLHVPGPIILILFRTMWLLPRFMERVEEVITAQRLRGMRIDTTFQRIRAVIPTLTPIAVSMLYETYEYAMTMTIRGFLVPGRKTHVHELRFGTRDMLTILVCGTALVLTVLVKVA